MLAHVSDLAFHFQTCPQFLLLITYMKSFLCPIEAWQQWNYLPSCSFTHNMEKNDYRLKTTLLLPFQWHKWKMGLAYVLLFLHALVSMNSKYHWRIRPGQGGHDPTEFFDSMWLLQLLPSLNTHSARLFSHFWIDLDICVCWEVLQYSDSPLTWCLSKNILLAPCW